MKRIVKKPRGRTLESKKNITRTSDSTVLIVFLAFLLFIIFFFGSSGKNSSSVKEEQQKLLNMLVIPDEREDGNAIIVGNIVYSERVSELASKDYPKLKELAGISSEFVIYFEDEEGNVINVAGKPCIGSSYAMVNGSTCDT